MSTIRHVPFLKALANAKGSHDPVWRDASTGFLVLRFFDRWLEDGPVLMSADPGLPALRARLRTGDDVEPHVRHLLLTAINALIDAESADPAPVSGPLLAYAAYLDSVGRTALAAHVYVTVAHALDGQHALSDPISTATTFVHHGYAARRSGEFEEAKASYERAIEIASAVNDDATVFRAQTGLANVAKARGDLPSAESLLDRTVVHADTILSAGDHSSATHQALIQASCLARQSRGAVRQARGRHVEAIQDFFTALQMAYDRTQYEVILGDLAACAAEAGYRATARDAHAALAKSAHAPVVRSAALVNLLELTVLDDDREGFAQAQRDIAEFVTTYNGMPAEHAVHSALYQAYGAERFEPRAAAIAAYQNAAMQARTAGIHQVEFLAEQRLAALNASSEPLGAPIVAAPAQNLPESLYDIGKAIQELTLAEPQPMEQLYAKP